MCVCVLNIKLLFFKYIDNVQTFREKIYDVNQEGKVSIKLGPHRTINNIRCNLGVSMHERQKIMEWIIDQIQQEAATQEYGDAGDAHTILRLCVDALKIIIRAVIDAKVTQGHSPFHNLAILEKYGNNPLNFMICEPNSDAHRSYHVPIGSKYVIMRREIPFVVTGDGGRLKKTSNDVDITAILILRVLCFNSYVVHSKHNCVPLLISSLGDKDMNVKDYIQHILDDCPFKIKFCVFSTQLNAYVACNGRRYENGDWVWDYLYISGTVGPAGLYRLSGLTRWRHGIPCGVAYLQDELYEALVGRKYYRYERTYDDCCTIDDGTYYTLVHKELAQQWSDDIESDINNNLQSIDEEKQNNDTYMRKIRLELAKQKKHGFLYPMRNCLYDWVIDVSHSNWSVISHEYMLIVEIMWCVWETEYEMMKKILEAIPNEYITKQTLKYCRKNKDRNIDYDWKLHTTGMINRCIMQNFNKMLAYAAVVFDKYEQWQSQSQQIDRNYIRSTLIMIMFRVYTLLRKMYGILMIDFIPHGNGWRNGTQQVHPLIHQSIQCGNLAAYIAYNLFHSMV